MIASITITYNGATNKYDVVVVTDNSGTFTTTEMSSRTVRGAMRIIEDFNNELAE